MPKVPSLDGLRQEAHCELELSLGYIMSSSSASNANQDPASKNKKKKDQGFLKRNKQQSEFKENNAKYGRLLQ